CGAEGGGAGRVNGQGEAAVDGTDELDIGRAVAGRGGAGSEAARERGAIRQHDGVVIRLRARGVNGNGQSAAKGRGATGVRNDARRGGSVVRAGQADVALRRGGGGCVCS